MVKLVIGSGSQNRKALLFLSMAVLISGLIAPKAGARSICSNVFESQQMVLLLHLESISGKPESMRLSEKERILLLNNAARFHLKVPEVYERLQLLVHFTSSERLMVVTNSSLIDLTSVSLARNIGMRNLIFELNTMTSRERVTIGRFRLQPPHEVYVRLFQAQIEYSMLGSDVSEEFNRQLVKARLEVVETSFTFLPSVYHVALQRTLQSLADASKQNDALNLLDDPKSSVTQKSF